MSDRQPMKPDPEATVRILDRMLRDSQYSFAWDRLKDMREWILDNDHVTTDMMKAINNIRRGGDRL